MKPWLVAIAIAIAIAIGIAIVRGEATATATTTTLPSDASSDCPLDLSWSNFTAAASVCSNPSERGRCCRYISVFVSVSVARYANMTGRLGVPPAFSEMCVNSVSETLKSHGIPADVTAYCGLGAKILVGYQCKGRTNVLEMLQSPNFNDVASNCKVQLNDGASCKECLNSAILYLHHLIEANDNAALSICRDATFVALINHADQASVISKATCFFGVQGLDIPIVDSPGTTPPAPLRTPDASPSSISAQPPGQKQTTMFAKQQHPHNHLIVIKSVGIAVIVVSVLLLVLLIVLICKKSKQLK